MDASRLASRRLVGIEPAVERVVVGVENVRRALSYRRGGETDKGRAIVWVDYVLVNAATDKLVEQVHDARVRSVALPQGVNEGRVRPNVDHDPSVQRKRVPGSLGGLVRDHRRQLTVVSRRDESRTAAHPML